MMKQIKVPRGMLADPRTMARAIANGLDAEAKRVESDLAATTETWDERVDFAITSPSPYRRAIGTRNPIWGMLNVGTRPHLIRAKPGKVLTWMGNAYRAKTRVGYLTSYRGGNNNTIVYARAVQHPGTAARKWTEAAAAKSQREFAKQMQRAIDAEIG